MRKSILLFVCFVLTYSFFVTAVQQGDEDVEKIKVTGSRITRIDVEGPSPLVIYNKEDIENSGYSSAGDFLRDTTVAHFGVHREAAGSSVSGESFTGMKGEKALILINGLRVVEDPNAESVDLNLIPIYAIERVEVLKDGASALYGSDAVGGVINFITKKTTEGIEIHAQVAPTIAKGNIKDLGSFYKGGASVDIATVFGNTNNKGSYVASFQLRFQDSITNSERVWRQGLTSPFGPYGVFNGQIDPNCPEDLKSSDGCKFDYSEYSTAYPRYAQLHGYLQGDYKINEINLYAQAITSYKNNKWAYAPVPVYQLKIPAGHKMSVGGGQEGLLNYRFIEAGKRDAEYHSFVADLTVGAKGYVSSTWDYDVSVKLAHVLQKGNESGLLLIKELTEAITNGDYDPFYNENTPSLLKRLAAGESGPFKSEKRDLSKANYTAKNSNDSTLLMTSLDFSGESGIWDIDLATGVQAYFKNFDNNADEQSKKKIRSDGKIKSNLLSNAGSDGYGERYLGSVYLEAVKYFSDILELQLAGRGDYYSDFGLTLNPKLAFRLKPQSNILFRGSLGTAFLAPSLHSLYQSVAEGFPWIFDTVACYNELNSKNAFNKVYEKLGDLSSEKKETLAKDFLIEQKDVISRKKLSKEVKEELKTLSKSLATTEYCKNRQISSETVGNKELKETKALVASLGSHLQIADQHSLTVDVWYIQKSGVVSGGVGKKTIDAELRFGNEHVKEEGITISRDSKNSNNPLTVINAKLLNLAKTQVSGIDLDWESNLDNINVFNGNLYFTDQVSYIFFFKTEGFPKIGYVDFIGKYGKPQWKNIASFGWKNEKHNVSLTAYTVSSFAKETSEFEKLPIYTRLDLDYQFLMNSKTTFKFGWSNLFFSTPPLDKDSSGTPLEHDIFESKGPFFFAGVKHVI